MAGWAIALLEGAACARRREVMGPLFRGEAPAAEGAGGHRLRPGSSAAAAARKRYDRLAPAKHKKKIAVWNRRLPRARA